MFKKLLFIACVLLPALLLAQQSQYSRIKITLKTSLENLISTGIDVQEINYKEKYAIAELSTQEISLIKNAGFEYEVLIADVSDFYAKRYLNSIAKNTKYNTSSSGWTVPANFTLGSCGGFSTVDEMLAQLDLMHQLYPALISVKQAVNDTVLTIEGKKLYYVRISDNAVLNENEPEVLYTGMHHAREPIGMQHLLYYMWYLLENYEADSSVRALVDNTEMYFVPIINVDGYTYNISTHPYGGGLWRKNRRNNGTGYFGVDINRNYGYKWGFDNTGSSPVDSLDNFRGTSAFSEPETRMMKYFCENHEFRIALNYHSYANLLLYAWGWSMFPTPDEAVLNAYACEMTSENGYTYGPGNTTIYPTNGGSDDWMYGEQSTKPTIFAYTPEIGSSADGFWPTQDRILPLIQENMLGSITAARLAGKYATISDNTPLFIQNKSGYFNFSVKRLGMQDGTFTAAVVPLNNSITAIGGAKTFSSLALLQTINDSIYYELKNNIQTGDTIQYVLTLNNGNYILTDTVLRIYGYPITIFEDKFSNTNYWTGTWQITGNSYYSPPGSLTDSPNGNYLTNSTNDVTLKTALGFNNPLLIVLQFRAHWALENDYDYVQLSISTDNGSTWTPLKGKYTNAGSPYQASNQPLYDGTKNKWIRESISLNDYRSQNVKFRFRLKSDQGLQMDGFYVDDFNVCMLLDPTIIGPLTTTTKFMEPPFPNPATKQTTIHTQIPPLSLPAKIDLVDSKGSIIDSFEISESQQDIIIPTHSLSKGLYFLHLSGKTISDEYKKLVVQ